MKHSIRIAVASLALTVSAGFGALVFAPAPQANALTCAILPKSICDAADNKSADTSKSGIFLLLTWVINILTAIIGIAAIGAIVYAGILYSSAGDDSGMVTKAKTIIRDTIIGIVAYGLMFLILNWLVPGGVIGLG